MKKLGIIFTLCLFLTSLIAGTAVVGSAWADDGNVTYPIMQPDLETREEWIEAYNNAPRAYIEREGFQVPSPRGSQDLLSHLDYTPSERNQGACGNCWAWAGTGCLEIALDVQHGIKDRLSVQYINSCEWDVIEKPCCTGGWLFEVADFHDATGMAIPWSNTAAWWQDGDASCDTACASISKTPNYPITSIDETTIPTQTVSQATAIANIKDVLNQDKGVWFGFFVPTNTAWNNFVTWWQTNGETAVYNLDQDCGTTYTSGGGHAVLCVGYNDDDPENKYWIMLNSWGTGPTDNRPNGLFRINMNMNYGCTCQGLGDGNYAFYWQTLDVTFGPEIWVFPTSFDETLPPNTTQDYTLTIGNDGDADLNYDISDQQTTGMSAPAGVETPALPPGQPGQQIEPIGLEPSEPISFAPPPPLTGTPEELAYDDGEVDAAWCWGGIPAGPWAVRFTPSSYPVSLQTARICLADPAWYITPWPDSDHEAFDVEVYDDDGTGGTPGTLLGSVTTTATNWMWWDVDISGLGVTVTEGDFYIAYNQLTNFPDCEGLCADYDAPDGRSWAWNGAAWVLAENITGQELDWMIRCVVEPCDCPWLSENPTSGTVVPGASHNITVTMNTTGLAAGNYSAEIVIDSNDPAENTTIVPVTLHVVVMPDLVVAKSVELSGENFTFTVSYNVTNIGNATANASTTCKFINATLLKESQPCPPLAPGESHSGQFDPEPCPCGQSLNVTVCADNDDVVAESDETNNCELNIVDCPMPDLVVSKSVELSGENFTVSYNVTNIGNATANASTTCKFINATLLKESQPCPPLAPGESHSGQFDPEPCPCGQSLNVTVCADNDDVVAESDETNNCELNIVDCPKADLVITEKWEEWVDLEGKTYNISYTVANQGCAAGASNTTITIDGIDVLEDPVPPLAAGANYSNTLGPYIMSGDSDNITVCADNNDVVDESNETNNCQNNTFYAGVLITGVTTQVRCDPEAGVAVTVYDGGEKGNTTSNASGNYSLASSISETGTYTVLASKTGFRDKSQQINISDLGQQYELDFRGETGLVPNAATASYAMDCVNHWLFPPSPECGLSASRAMDVVNAWLFPIT